MKKQVSILTKKSAHKMFMVRLLYYKLSTGTIPGKKIFLKCIFHNDLIASNHLVIGGSIKLLYKEDTQPCYVSISKKG